MWLKGGKERGVYSLGSSRYISIFSGAGIECSQVGPTLQNNFELMYSRQRVSQNSFTKFLYIVPKSFIIFQQELLDADVSLGSSEWN
jgi:hypothetical protein